MKMQKEKILLILFITAFFSCRKDIRINESSQPGVDISQAGLKTASVLLASETGKCYSYNAASGSLNWVYNGGADFFVGIPAVQDSIAYLKSRTGNSVYLHAINISTGISKWVKKIGPIFFDASSPVVTKENVVYLTSGPKVLAINSLNGIVLWTWNANAGKGDIYSNPTFVNGSLYVADRFHIYSINAITGTLKWSYSDNNLTPQMSSPCVREGLVFYKNFSELVCLDTSGNKKWSTSILYGINSPTFDKGSVFTQSIYNYSNQPKQSSVYSINALTGNINWRFNTDSINYLTRGSVFYRANKIFMALKDSLVAINAINGQKLWSFFTGITSDQNALGSSEACGSNNAIYVAGLNHVLYAIDITSGQQLWSAGYGDGYYGDYNATPVFINGAADIHPTVSGMTQ